MNYIDAFDYVAAYADYQNIPLNEVFHIKNTDRFRGFVINIEFEYNVNDSILIARGYISQDEDRDFRDDIWNTLLKIEKDPESSIVKQILPRENIDLHNRKFEIDTTINEVKKKQLYRLNLRMDIVNNSLSINQFVKQIKKLSKESLLWDKKYFVKVIDYCNSIMMPGVAKSYGTTYANTHMLSLPFWVETKGLFSSKIGDLQFTYNYKSKDLSIYYPIKTIKDIDEELLFYNLKIEKDPDWYYRAIIVKEKEELFLNIMIGDYSRSSEETVEIIDSCINMVSLWQKELK